jgi:Arc/MetJ-type ribon-helix-helix transcriptional regulator
VQVPIPDDPQRSYRLALDRLARSIMNIYHEYMTATHEARSKRVSEPVQVYLDRGQRRRLDQLAAELGLSKSDVVRRGLEALERQLADPAEHPALRIIGIASRETTKSAKYDIAVEHDRYLAETEQKSWKRHSSRKRGS